MKNNNPSSNNNIILKANDIKTFLNKKRNNSNTFAVSRANAKKHIPYQNLLNAVLKESGLSISSFEQYVLMIHSYFLSNNFLCSEGGEQLLNLDWDYTYGCYKFTYHYKKKENNNESKFSFLFEEDKEITYVIRMTFSKLEDNKIKIEETTNQNKSTVPIEKMKDIKFDSTDQTSNLKLLTRLLDNFTKKVIASLSFNSLLENFKASDKESDYFDTSSLEF